MERTNDPMRIMINVKCKIIAFFFVFILFSSICFVFFTESISFSCKVSIFQLKICNELCISDDFYTRIYQHKLKTTVRLNALYRLQFYFYARAFNAFWVIFLYAFSFAPYQFHLISIFCDKTKTSSKKNFNDTHNVHIESR